MRITVIILIIFFSSCKARIYTSEQLNRIRITDSISNAQKQDLIIDYQEDYDRY